MVECVQLDDALSVGSQPTEAELKDLASRGIRSVVNLRVDGEEDQPLTPREEGVGIRNLGLEYVSIAVPIGDIQPMHVDNFRAKLQYLPTPVFVHCAGGRRAITLALIHKALSEGWRGREALEQARRLGMPCDSEPMQSLVVDYIDEHQQKED